MRLAPLPGGLLGKRQTDRLIQSWAVADALGSDIRRRERIIGLVCLHNLIGAGIGNSLKPLLIGGFQDAGGGRLALAHPRRPLSAGESSWPRSRFNRLADRWDGRTGGRLRVLLGGLPRAAPIRCGASMSLAQTGRSDEIIPRRMGEQRGELDLAARLFDTGGLDGGNLLLAESLADDVQAGGELGIAEDPVLFSREGRPDDRNHGLFRVHELGLGSGQAAAMVPMRLLDRCMGCLRNQSLEADRAGLGTLGLDPVARRLLGVLRYERLQVRLGRFVLAMGLSGPRVGGRKIRP